MNKIKIESILQDSRLHAPIRKMIVGVKFKIEAIQKFPNRNQSARTSLNCQIISRQIRLRERLIVLKVIVYAPLMLYEYRGATVLLQ
jgi:hypothetical protein